MEQASDSSGEPGEVRSMKVAYLAPASSVHACRWATAIREHGYDVEFITMHDPEGRAGLSPGIRVHHLPFPAPAGYYLNRWHLRRLLRRLRPALLHAHYATGYGTLSRMARYHPTLLSVWGSDVLVFPRLAPWRRNLVRRNLLAADYVASTSRVLRTAVAELAATPRPIFVSPFGVDCSRFGATPTRASEGPLVIGTVKGLERTAGIDTLLHAFAILSKRNAHLKLLLVGEGPERQALQHLASTLGCASQVTFAGAVPHAAVPQLLAQMSIFAYLSNSEGFGVAVLEASACGLPVVASRVGGLPEVVQEGVTGLLVQPRSPEAAALAIESVFRDPTLRTRMGAAGRAFVLENFEWRNTVDIVTDIYHTIIQESRGRWNNSVRSRPGHP